MPKKVKSKRDKLTMEDAYDICFAYIPKITLASLAKKYNVSIWTIRDVLNGKTWKNAYKIPTCPQCGKKIFKHFGNEYTQGEICNLFPHKCKTYTQEELNKAVKDERESILKELEPFEAHNLHITACADAIRSRGE